MASRQSCRVSKRAKSSNQMSRKLSSNNDKIQFPNASRAISCLIENIIGESDGIYLSGSNLHKIKDIIISMTGQYDSQVQFFHFGFIINTSIFSPKFFTKFDCKEDLIQLYKMLLLNEDFRLTFDNSTIGTFILLI